MDDELLRLVNAVRTGAIRDPERVRQILKRASAVLEKRSRRVRELYHSLDAAKLAFVEGWPTSDINTGQ